MSDDDGDEESEPAVELGDGTPVEGAPLARVASRLTWPQKRSDIIEKEGDSEIRTPDGPQDIASILEDTDTTYFATRQDFRAAVESVVGTGPVATAE
jgi:hypothetical protein